MLALVKPRLDWGLGNPNTTASLIALLLIAVWVMRRPVSNHPKIAEALFWVALLGCSAFYWPLAHTASRGGMTAAAAGLTVLIFFSERPWPKRHVAGVVGSALFALGLLVSSTRATRLNPLNAPGDGSVLHRLDMWKHIPKMLADAPGGWGSGHAPEAFAQWYQEPDWHDTYLNLLNSHLTWLTEMGWVGRLAYVMAWGLAVRLAWPDKIGTGVDGKLRRLSAVPLALVVSLFVGAVFSHVAGEWQLWVLPLIALFVSAVVRIRTKNWGSVRSWVISAAAPCLLLAMAVLPFTGRSGLSVSNQGASVVLGKGAPRLLIIVGEGAKESERRLRTDIDPNLLNGSIVWTREPARFSAMDFPSVVILGHPSAAQVKPFVTRATRVMLMAPQYAPQELFSAETLGKVTSYVGEFSASEFSEAWRATGRAETLEGTGDFIGDWTDRIQAMLKKRKHDAS